MTLVLLGGFSTVFAAVGKQLYLCGDSPIGNGWGYGSGSQVSMSYNSETGINTKTVTITGTENKYFVVTDGYSTSGWDDFNGNNRYDFGTTDTQKDLSYTGSFQLAQNSDGNYANYLSPGTYKIVIDSETMVMSILKTTSVSFTVENNDYEAWSQLALYNDIGDETKRTLGSWPGVVLYDGTNLNPNNDPRVDVTKEGNTFTVKLWVNYDDIILSNNKNGIDVDEGNNQMTLTDFADDKAYTIAAQTVPSSYSTTIYFINNNSWNRIALYNFNGSGKIYGDWPGKFLISSNGILNPQKTSLFKVSKAGKTTEDKDVYKIELGDETGYNTIIFTNNNGDKTGDITDVADGNYYYCDSGTSHGGAPSYKISTGKDYITYVSPDKLDFTGATNLTAYIATSADNTNVTLKPVTKVPANTPLVLKRANETASHNVVVLTSDADDVSGNKLVAGDGVTIIGGESKFDYVLKDGTFFRATVGVVAVGKAYLHLDSDPGTTPGKLSIIFDDSSETDGIKSVKNGKFAAENAYNLAGQKVGANYKGIVIVNGKKVVRK